MLLPLNAQNVRRRLPEAYVFPSAKPSQAGPHRDVAIDFTKGALVMFMVLYHWLNYCVGTHGHYYNYLRFLTPAFIFISGFMISHIQLPRYKDSGPHLPKRLFVRGLKLLMVFLLLNVLIGIASSHSLPHVSEGKPLGRFLWAAFVVGNGPAREGQKSVAFNILVPIGYLLIISGGMVLAHKHAITLFYCTLCVLVAAVIIVTTNGLDNLYLELLMVGSLGVVVGCVGSTQIKAVISHPYLLAVLYCIYLAVITMRDVILPLQVAGVILTTALLYVAGGRRGAPGLVWRFIILLGKYSLLGYISQIAILQGLRRSSLLSEHGVAGLLGSLLLGVLLTAIVVKTADLARRTSRAADGVYRLVFA